jgi:type II secretory pathway component PulJ
MRNRSGVSLLEVIIALTLVAFVAHGVATMLATATRWQRLADTRLEQLDDVRAVLASETRRTCAAAADSVTLRHAVDRTVRDEGALRQITVRVRARGDTMSFVTVRTCP